MLIVVVHFTGRREAGRGAVIPLRISLERNYNIKVITLGKLDGKEHAIINFGAV